jgi:preprotein translocase subunit SecE
MAATEVQTVNTTADRIKLIVSASLMIAAIVAFYWLAKQGAVTQWAVLLFGFLVSIIVFFTSESGKSLISFGRDTVREVRKVVWPERKEALQITVYVFAFVVIMALFLWLTDKTLEWFFYDLILGWKK